MDEQSLSHHGIMGQKWGVRRFQNADGSLTPAGRRRYSNEHPSYDEMQKVVKQKGMEQAYDKALGRKEKSSAANDVRSVADQSKNAINSIKNNYRDMRRATLVKPDVSKMTNKELQDAITRMNLEDNYVRLVQNREAQQLGQDKVEKMLDAMGTVAQVASTAAAVAALIWKIKGV